MASLLIDGAEGGGQVLRTALAMSAVTGQPFELVNARANRGHPGLKRQHLACVRAVAEICGASVSGDVIDSESLQFTPGKIKAGDYRFDVCLAGSVALLAQTILPVLAFADKESTVTITGGTHVPLSPCWEYFEKTYLPELRAMGLEVEVSLVKYGFYPAGGGEVRLTIKPWTAFRAYEYVSRDALSSARVVARVANLDLGIAQAESKRVAKRMRPRAVRAQYSMVESMGPGNYCVQEMSFGTRTMVMSDVGLFGKSRREVADAVVARSKAFLSTGCAVDNHLSDQLLVPIVLLGLHLPKELSVWGRFAKPLRTTGHFDATWEVLAEFVPEAEYMLERVSKRMLVVTIGTQGILPDRWQENEKEPEE